MRTWDELASYALLASARRDLGGGTRLRELDRDLHLGLDPSHHFRAAIWSSIPIGGLAGLGKRHT